jgi:type II secretory pathway component PulK
MESLSELMLIRGYRQIPEEKRKRLETLLTALPDTTAINVNSASDELLRAIGFKSEGIQAIRTRLDKGGAGPIQSMEELKSLKLLSEERLEGLTTTTEYFLLTATAQIGRTRLKQYSIIHRSPKGALQVVARSLGTP